MMVVDGGDSGHHQGQGNSKATARQLQVDDEGTEMQRQSAIAPAQVWLIEQ
jgi:hypothetical protein